jgi:hypothetical protein
MRRGLPETAARDGLSFAEKIAVRKNSCQLSAISFQLKKQP